MAEPYSYGALSPDRRDQAIEESSKKGPSFGEMVDTGVKGAIGKPDPSISPMYGPGATPQPTPATTPPAPTPNADAKPASVAQPIAKPNMPEQVRAPATTPPAGSLGATGEGDSVPLNYSLGDALPKGVAGTPSMGLDSESKDNPLSTATPDAQSTALGKAMENNPTSSGRELIDIAAGGGQPYAPIFADQSKQVGTAQFSTGQSFDPSVGKPAMAQPGKDGFTTVMSGNGTSGPATTGGSDVPLYETNYRDKDGKTIATVTGQNQRVGGGTLSVVSGRTPEEDAAIKQRVASINQQTDTLRKFNIESGRSYAPSSGNESTVSSPGSLWDRPGDRFGDAQMRESKYASLVDDAANAKGFGARQIAERKLGAAAAMLSPYQQERELQQKDAASRNSLAGSKYATDAGLTGKRMDYEASLEGSRLTAAQQAEKNRIDAEKTNAELGNQREDVITRRAALSKQSGTDQLAQAKIQLSGQYAAAKTPAEQQAIIQQAAILGVRPDDLMMAGVSTAPN